MRGQLQVQPRCEHHMTALECEPEDTDCLIKDGDWLAFDLSVWWCPIAEQTPNDTIYCNESWYIATRQTA